VTPLLVIFPSYPQDGFYLWVLAGALAAAGAGCVVGWVVVRLRGGAR
jgi:hypothetical protein